VAAAFLCCRCVAAVVAEGTGSRRAGKTKTKTKTKYERYLSSHAAGEWEDDDALMNLFSRLVGRLAVESYSSLTVIVISVLYVQPAFVE
jgi:hypothetical protein